MITDITELCNFIVTCLTYMFSISTFTGVFVEFLPRKYFALLLDVIEWIQLTTIEYHYYEKPIAIMSKISKIKRLL